MPAKMARSAPRPSSRLPERPVMRRQLASVLWQGRKMPILSPVRESSGESRLRSCGGRACPGRLASLGIGTVR